MVRCKLRCTNKTLVPRQNADQTTSMGAQLQFSAVFEADPKLRSSENAIFGDATPFAQFNTYIANERAHAQFEQGKDYYFDASPAMAIAGGADPEPVKPNNAFHIAFRTDDPRGYLTGVKVTVEEEVVDASDVVYIDLADHALYGHLQDYVKGNPR